VHSLGYSVTASMLRNTIKETPNSFGVTEHVQCQENIAQTFFIITPVYKTD